MAIVPSDVAGPHESVRIFVLEERKRGVQKQLGEVTLSVAGLPTNQTVQNSYPIIGDKGATIGELRIRATYSVDIILPTADYNDLLTMLITPGMPLVRHLSAVTKEKSTTARHLIHIFQARDVAEGFIRTIVQEEIDRTDSIEVLFRGNTVCTKAMDHFMKLVGSMYQREVLMPIVEVINREAASLEVQKEKMTNGEDWKRNVARLQKLTELLLQRIFQSVNHCPPPVRNLLSFIREASIAKFPHAPTVKHTSVTSFIFLRFFVPAVLNPKLFGLTANMPSEQHMRIFTLVAGILQKLANLTKYRELELYINALNPFLEENFPKARAFVDDLVAIEPVGRGMQRRMSVANTIQIDVHLAGLVRELNACRGPLLGLVDSEPLMPVLFQAVDKINAKLEAVKELINVEEEGLSSLSTSSEFNNGLDSLLSKVIQTEVQRTGNANVVTVKRAPEEPLPEGATKARQRSGSFFSRLFSGDKKKVVPKSGPVRPAGANSLDSIPAGRQPPPGTPSSEFSHSPIPRSMLEDVSSSSSGIRSSQDSSDFGSTTLSSSFGATSSMKIPQRPTDISPSHAGASSMKVGSAPTRPLPTPTRPVTNHNLDVINQHREQMRVRPPGPGTGATPPPSPGTAPKILLNRSPATSKRTAPPPYMPPKSPSVSPVHPMVRRPITPEPWFGDTTLMSDLEAMEQQTDYHGFDAGRTSPVNMRLDEEPEDDEDLPNNSFLHSSASSVQDDARSDSSAMARSGIAEEDEDVEEPEEVVVVKLDLDMAALEAEFDKLEKIIQDIQAIPLPATPKRDPKDILPELRQLEMVVESLEAAVVFTTPKIHIGGDGLVCKFCLGNIDTGSRFLVVMGQNFHEGHLNCNVCSRDLSDCPFQWYKEKSYCFDCYKKGHGIRPVCAHCNQPIMTATYTQALGKLWHPEHFCCTVCGVGFPDGAFYNFDGKPYCPKHQNRGLELPNCGMCLMPILDRNYVEALGQKWHSHHFCCDICGIQLLGQFVTYTKADQQMGKACETHF